MNDQTNERAVSFQQEERKYHSSARMNSSVNAAEDLFLKIPDDDMHELEEIAIRIHDSVQLNELDGDLISFRDDDSNYSRGEY